MTLDPVILFFLLGIVAKLLKSDLRLPEAMYDALSLYLLLAIGIKGGVELAKFPVLTLLPHAAGVIALGFSIPFLLFPILRLLKLGRADAAAIAGHYGSVSIVTFAVASSWLIKQNISSEEYMPLFVALMEAPGLIAAILLSRAGALADVSWKKLAHEVLCGKSVLLLMGGLIIGALVGPTGIAPLKFLFIDLFKSLLAFFLLEMGLVAGARLGDLKRAGIKLALFALLVPVALGALGALVGTLLGLSVGGATIVGVLAASASYIAAPTAMRIAIPEANPALSIGMALGITFPFNLIVGIPLYYQYALHLAR